MPRLERQVSELDAYYSSLIDRGRDKLRNSINVSDWGIDAYEGYAEPIEWIVKDVLPHRTVGLIASMGGIGKSYLMLDLAVRVAAGPGKFGATCFGGQLVDQGPVIMVTAEDSRNAIHRRLNQIINVDQHAKLKDLFIVPLPDAGGVKPFLECIGGQYTMTAAWDDMCSEIIKHEAILGLIDPMQAVVTADVNSDPAAAQCYWSSVSKLCAESGASVLTSHHMRKDGNVDGVASARAAIRGTSALVDGCRWAFALFPVPDDERTRAERALGESLGPLELVNGAVVKSNEFGMGEMVTFRRDKNSGLLIDISEALRDEIAAASKLSQQQIHEIFFEISKRWDAGDPFSGHWSNQDRYLGRFVSDHYDLDYGAAKDYVKTWIKKRNVVVENHPKIPRAKALRRRETPVVEQ